LIGINDHLGEWEQGDSRDLTDREILVATMSHQLRFNNSPDWYSDVARTFVVFFHQPERGPLASAERWEELQRQAFGTTFREYFESFIYPVAMQVLAWDGSKPPIISHDWLDRTAVRRDLLSDWWEDLAIDPATAKPLLQPRLRPTGIPHAPTVLLRKPLLRLRNGNFVPASPWAMRAQLLAGIWARLLAAAKALNARDGAQIWLSTFGDSFESWCREVAQDAAACRWFRGRLLLPSKPGAVDEIEDIVLLEGRAAVLFSVKSRMVAENVARWAQSRTALLDWYEDFFFGTATTTHRQGTARLLNARIDRIRSGDFEPTLARDARLLPVVVTYDSMCDHELWYDWLCSRCEVHSLFQQAQVGPLTVARVDEFEALMKRASMGKSVVEVLRKREGAWKNRRLAEVLAAMNSGSRKGFRLPVMEKLFDEVFENCTQRLGFKANPEAT